MQLGYNEINLNLGCPSATVVSKNRGSGFLSKTDDLDAFLNEIFTLIISRSRYRQFANSIPAILLLDTVNCE